MPRATLANNATSTLNGAITQTATSIVLVDGSKFPSSGYFWVTLLDSAGVVEVALCTSRAGNTLTVTRGQDGTSAPAAGFASGSKCSLNITKAVLNELAPLTGEGTSGSWSISISGTAANATNATTATTATTATNSTQLGGVAAASYARSGANTDITSLNAPSLGAATATTAAAADNDTSVATTAFVQQELTSQAVKLTGAQTVAGVKTFSSMPVLPVRSTVVVSSPNGMGSTNTCIQNFAIADINTGSDITWTSSATLGSVFTINTTGVYAMDFLGQHPNTSGWVGISRNAQILSQLSTPIQSMGNTSRLAIVQCYAATAMLNVNATRDLTAGDVIRVHTDGAPVSGAYFSITRVA